MERKYAELHKAVRHLDMLNQFAIKVAEEKMPGFAETLAGLAKKVERLQKELVK